jgi:flavoprotein
MRYLFLLLFSLISALIIAQQDKAAGYWYGQLEIMGTQHELLFEVVNQTNANGKLLKGKYDLFLLNPDDSTRMSIDIDKIETALETNEINDDTKAEIKTLITALNELVKDEPVIVKEPIKAEPVNTIPENYYSELLKGL